MEHQQPQWPRSAQGERPRLSLQTASPTLPPYPVNDNDARSLVASKLWGEQRRYSDSFSQMSNQALYHESLDKFNLARRTGLSFFVSDSFDLKESAEQEAQCVVDLGGSVTYLPSPQPSPTFKPASSPSRAALAYTPLSAKRSPFAESRAEEEKIGEEGNEFVSWKEFAPTTLPRRSSSLQSQREQVLDAVSGLGFKGPVKGLGKLSRPVLNKYYRTEQALAEFMTKEDRVLLRPLSSPEVGQRELERLETELFDTSKYMGNTSYMTILTWSDDSPWGTITLFQVDALPTSVSQEEGGGLQSRRRRPINLHLDSRPRFSTQIRPVAAMEHIPHQVLINMRMDTAVRKLVLVHEPVRQRFRWLAKGEMGHPSYASLYRPDFPAPIPARKSVDEHLDDDEVAILGHRPYRRRSRLSPNDAYLDQEENTAEGIVATIPQFLALLHSTQSIVEVISSSTLSNSERVETTSGEAFRQCALKQPPQGKRHTGRDVHVVVLLPVTRSSWVEERLFWTDEQGHLAELRQKRYRSVIDGERDTRRERDGGRLSGRRGRSPEVGGMRSPPLSATLYARDSVW
ncbi:hypothetical protein QBC36DRAFT_319680 [Triangularia setosa]|uniref:Uncharacterized protein n=1 Tax=Triangularia setosa TaxID=2587417 RepID=A0AAN6WEK1_9PEZI|nr:hypothetical protein QBC36DRAFT_319680 [Podospora setosa]